MFFGKKKFCVGVNSGLSFRTKLNLGQTQETPFGHCLGLKTLQIRDITFSMAKLLSKKGCIGTHICKY